MQQPAMHSVNFTTAVALRRACSVYSNHLPADRGQAIMMHLETAS